MSFYDRLDIRPVINASEPYTKLGGSCMSAEVRKSMYEASECMIDMEQLYDTAYKRAAELTHNEAAMFCPGAAAGVVLASAAMMLSHDPSLAEVLPVKPQGCRDEILLFDGNYLKTIRYWKQIECSGAKPVYAGRTAEELLSRVNERTAGVFLFVSTMYEEDITPAEESIPALKKAGLAVAVDAAAQLPPRSNMWHYTKDLGADMVIFSGGKHLAGPQASGLVLGKEKYIRLCRSVACPNPLLGRALKIGREEVAGLLTALEIFMADDDQARFDRQQKMLEYIYGRLRLDLTVSAEIEQKGRLGTFQPLLVIRLPEGKTGEGCCAHCRACEPAVDTGYYNMGLHDGDPQLMFINAYNLKEDELDAVVSAVNGYLTE
ncbi:MAG: aminotransferase class V-fold PLP-dependent enzyme [Firmicutes bacterium]|nr:aminotransferase class V-fold PLP-dependent enzyme [Bacillota bacterium]